MLKPISQSIVDILEGSERSIERTVAYLRKEAKEAVERVERNRPIIPLLQDFGYICTGEWDSGQAICVDIGIRPSRGKKAKQEFSRKLVGLRAVLGRLSLGGKDVANADDAAKREARVILRAVAYPGISIVYKEKLPKTAKCRIVKNVYHQLVCEA